MSIELKHDTVRKFLEVHVSGKLEKADYERFVPAIERLIGEHGRIRILFEMRAFHGWSPGALWEDVKFDVKHFRDIERLAIVGEKKWQQGMAHFCKPFTTAQIRYFERDQVDQAREWLQQ
jgi:hypothetical protein